MTDAIIIGAHEGRPFLRVPGRRALWSFILERSTDIEVLTASFAPLKPAFNSKIPSGCLLRGHPGDTTAYSGALASMPTPSHPPVLLVHLAWSQLFVPAGGRCVSGAKMEKWRLRCPAPASSSY